jgi:hypothetical protein
MHPAVLRDINCRPTDRQIFFRSKSGAFHEASCSTGVWVLRHASKNNDDRVIVSPFGQPNLIACVCTSSLKPYIPDNRM